MAGSRFLSGREAIVLVILLILVVVLAITLAAGSSVAKSWVGGAAVVAASSRFAGGGKKRSKPASPSASEINRILKSMPDFTQAHGGGTRTDAAARFSSPRARARADKEDVVVDTLNLTHHLLESGALQEYDEQVKEECSGSKTLTKCAIVAAIRYSTEVLREHFPGRITYVIKDRESLPNDPSTRALYRQVARETKAHIHIVERSKSDRDSEQGVAGSTRKASWQPTGEDVKKGESGPHQRLGRDDFYLGLLAWKLRCGALTEDRMRDFDKLKIEVAPFTVHEISPWSETATKNYVNPSAQEYRQVRAPPRLRYKDFGL